jgi:hypothetical protein
LQECEHLATEAVNEEPKKKWPRKVSIPVVLGIWALNVFWDAYVMKWPAIVIGFECIVFFFILMAAIDPWGEG